MHILFSNYLLCSMSCIVYCHNHCILCFYACVLLCYVLVQFLHLVKHLELLKIKHKYPLLLHVLSLIFMNIAVSFFRNGEEPSGTTVSQLHHAQRLYLSAFHPDTGDLQNVIGRMSFYVPGGMILIGAMVTFYK